MPYFKMKLELNQELLTRLRALPVRAQQNMKTLIATELAPDLEQDANDLMAEGPEVSSPFVFGTDLSMRKYFYMVRHGEVETDGEHYLREPGPDTVQGGFRAEVSSTRFNIGMIQIRNLHPRAKYVYGPWAVQGHINTGWPQQAEIVRQLLREKAVERVEEMWKKAVTDAAKGINSG